MQERDIFAAAIEMADPQARSSWLDEICGDDRALRGRVDLLLSNHDPDASFLERPPFSNEDAATLAHDGDTDGGDATTGPDGASGGEIDLAMALGILTPSDESLGRLGEYEVVQVIGRGGMGIVFKGLDSKLGRPVALKVLAPELSANPSARERFLHEARAVAAASAPNIVTIHYVYDGRHPFLAMEFVDGPSLSDLIAEGGAMDETQVVAWGLQIAEGLAAAHRRGLTHRDIKPGNILIESETGRVIITDFGLARAADHVGVTRSGEVLGTPQYMSPEQAQGKPTDQRTDLFGFGATLYAICTGQPPFGAPTLVSVLRLVCDEDPQPVRERNPKISRWLADFIDRLMAKRPEDRFQTSVEVAELLRGYLLHLRQPRSVRAPHFQRVERAVEKPRPGPARPRAMMAVALGVLLTLGAFEAVGVTQFAGMVMRLAFGEGTLVIQVDDPAVAVSVEGDNVRFQWEGNDLKLRPGDYRVTALKDGEPIQREVVSVSRDERRLFRVGLESAPKTSGPAEKANDASIAKPEIGSTTNDPSAMSADAPPLAKVPFSASQARAHQEAWAKHLNLPVEYTNSLGMTLRLIPPGEFQMGLNDVQLKLFQSGDEAIMTPAYNLKSVVPLHPVRITKPYYMAVREVTYRQYEQVMGPGIFERRLVKDLSIDDPLKSTCSWQDAVEFCNALSRTEGFDARISIDGVQASLTQRGNGYRLPTEAEWEFACRSGTESIWFYGLLLQEWIDRYHADRESLIKFHQKYIGANERPLPNHFGIEGLYGGSSEWCWDWSNDNYYATLPRDVPAIDPQGPPSGSVRVARGGASYTSSGLDPRIVNSVTRMAVRHAPTVRDKFLGFGRVVLDVGAVKKAVSAERERPGG